MLKRANEEDSHNSQDRVELQFGDLIAVLLRAQKLAEDVDRTSWDFATEIKSLEKDGLTKADFRWLVCNGFLEHRKEITQRGDTHRRFRDEHPLKFSKKSCFVLTTAGIDFAHDIVLCRQQTITKESEAVSGRGFYLPEQMSPTPHWNSQRHELTVNRQLVKRFRWPASNQETVLMAFEEDGWPDRIDDPLPPQPEQDSKRRLHDTIKCLNRNQINQILRFHGDGTGQGVLWQLVAIHDANENSR